MSDDTTALPTASASSKEIFFPQGIPGFENQQQYRLFHSDTESGRVYWMESLDNPEITFTLVNPRSFGLQYVFELDDAEQSLLQAEEPEDVVVLMMLWKPESTATNPPSGLHANITGPILINGQKRLGMQKILRSPEQELTIVRD